MGDAKQQRPLATPRRSGYRELEKGMAEGRGAQAGPKAALGEAPASLGLRQGGLSA